ncbi:MAG: DUF2817 domain-containing protein [Myxococcales bacterium]|nr:DUF2817 domain-containing protein [Myxococcales bacterium]
MVDGLEFFSDDYSHARTGFLSLAERRAATVTAYPISPRGPAGEELAIDVAWIGSREPRRALVVSSGIHGVEGFYGSAVQRQLLTSQLDVLALPCDVALVLVHAINPYGFAHLRRVNESNVDLNRNFVDHPGGHVRAPEYTALYDLLNPTDMDPEAEQARIARLFAIAEEQGFERLQQVVTGGQYEHPAGIQFGGQRQETSNANVRSLCRAHLGGLSELVWLDLHTGLGAPATLQAIMACPHDAPEMDRARAIWGDRAVSMRVPGQSASADLRGALAYGVAEELAHRVEVSLALAEVGTHDPVRVFLALRADNWLHHHGEVDSEPGRAIKAELKEAFCPADAGWRRTSLAVGAEVIAQAAAHFAAHDD